MITTKGKDETTEKTSSFSLFRYYNLTDKNWQLLNVNESVELISTSYYYYPDTLTTEVSGNTVGISKISTAYSTLFGTTTAGYYWLGANWITTTNGYLEYGIRVVGSGRYVGVGAALAKSYDLPASNHMGVRPVVYLNSNIKLKATEKANHFEIIK